MKKFLPILATSLLLLNACSTANEKESTNQKVSQNDSNHITHNHLSGDLQEQTASAKILPGFLDNQSKDIRLVYQVAGQATDILKWMPCYCGCGESAGHQSNLNCFIAEIHDDGSIVWDDHGTRCQVCLEIAVESVNLYQQGKSLKEIRTIIDEKYKEGYATPTPTEMPA